MGYTLLVTNVDGARVDGMWGMKPTAEELRYCIGGMYCDEQEQDIIDDLLDQGYVSIGDSACTTYELSQG